MILGKERYYPRCWLSLCPQSEGKDDATMLCRWKSAKMEHSCDLDRGWATYSACRLLQSFWVIGEPKEIWKARRYSSYLIGSGTSRNKMERSCSHAVIISVHGNFEIFLVHKSDFPSGVLFCSACDILEINLASWHFHTLNSSSVFPGHEIKSTHFTPDIDTWPILWSSQGIQLFAIGYQSSQGLRIILSFFGIWLRENQIAFNLRPPSRHKWDVQENKSTNVSRSYSHIEFRCSMG